QNNSDDTYRLLFILKDADLKQVKEESLKIVEQKMTDQIRQSNLEDARKDSYKQVKVLDLSENQTEVAEALMNAGIVVNTYLNEQKTSELKEKAKETVAPVMIYQGEIIVREGSQIDTTAIQKLNILGMTKQNKSF